MCAVIRPVRAFLALSLAVAAPALAGGGGGHSGKPHADPSVLEAFQQLESHVSAIPRHALPFGIRASLLLKLEIAERAYRYRLPCPAAAVLRAYLNETQRLRRGSLTRLMEDLHNRGWSLLQDLVASLPEGAGCKAEGRVGRPPEVGLTRSDNQRMDARISLGAPRLWTVEAGGETFTQVEIPGLETPVGLPGQPGVPTLYRLVAVPRGATPRVLFTTQVGDEIRLNLIPFQPQAVDQGVPPPEPPDPTTFANPPFVKDEQTYGTNAFLPANPCSVAVVGQSRDLQIAQLACAAGQYNPVTDTLRLFDSIDVRVSFDGGDGTFITSQAFSPFESSPGIALGSVLNRAAAAQYLHPVDLSGRLCFGEELLILTHPTFRPAADRLAAWKRDKGISTSVLIVNDGPVNPAPDTNDAIDALIEDRYESCVVRPSYVLLLGDAEFIPTFYPPGAAEFAGSDFEYSNVTPAMPTFRDVLPDLGVGRIPVDTLEQAETVVSKIVTYESDPPFVGFGSGAPFYTTAAIASQFQCCWMLPDGTTTPGQAGRDQRAFIETSELVRNVLVAQGYDVDRIYTKTVDRGGYCLRKNPTTGACDLVQQPYSADATPRRYYNATPLPPAVGPASGFAWNGDTNDIVAAWNEGRFLILHRDHGSWEGWSNPSFDSEDASERLDNGSLLPVVYSVNCASGLFDDETLPVNPFRYPSGTGRVYFAERLLRDADGGAVSLLGDTRNSPTWANNALTRGFFDATWPDTVPDFGDAATSQRRLGDILKWGKLYLATQMGAPQTAGDVSLADFVLEYWLWHVIGDPTLEMWTQNPWQLTLPPQFELSVSKAGLLVDYDLDGATITALQQTPDGLRPVGRAPVIKGQAFLDFVSAPDLGAPLILSASFPNAVSRLLTRDALLPDLLVSLAGPPDVGPGTDLAGLLTVEVTNQGNAAAPGTVDAFGAGKPGYMIDLVLSTDESVPEGFASLPPPDQFVEDGLLVGGRVSRTPDVPAGATITLSPAPPVSSDVGGTIPGQTPLGDYFLCARIDPGSAVAELDETNNVACLPVRVR